MRLIKPSFEIIYQLPGELGLLKHIETCGRVAWKSEDRTTDDSYLKFIEMLKSVNHGSVLEHGTVYLKVPVIASTINDGILSRYIHNKYSKCKENESYLYITTNYRVILDNNCFDDIIYLCEPTEFHEKRITVRFVCDRGVSHEFVRHRVFSFTQESTRYCNYSKDKFDNQLTYIIPCWFEGLKESTVEERKEVYRDKAEETNGWHSSDNAENNWVISLLDNEITYIDLIEKGWKPQQARAILPNSLKTELIMTGFESDWEHFFMLRDAAGAHPQASELATPLHIEFENRKKNEDSSI
jgi:thymidylate synthase (FAD)